MFGSLRVLPKLFECFICSVVPKYDMFRKLIMNIMSLQKRNIIRVWFDYWNPYLTTLCVGSMQINGWYSLERMVDVIPGQISNRCWPYFTVADVSKKDAPTCFRFIARCISLLTWFITLRFQYFECNYRGIVLTLEHV